MQAAGSAWSSSLRFSSPSFRPRSARFCRRSESPGWTGSCGSMFSRWWGGGGGGGEAAGDVDTLLLDKTGTITLGNRQAAEFIPLPGMSEKELADAAQLASLSDETPEGRSIVVLAKEKYGIRGRDMGELQAKFLPFSAYTRLSGIDTDTTAIRKGAVDAILAYVRSVVGATVTDNPGAVVVVRPSVSDGTVRALNASADKV